MWRLWLLAAALAIGFGGGWTVQDWRHRAADDAAAHRAVQVVRAAGEVSVAAAARDARAQTQIRTLTRTLIKEVPAHVPAETDAGFGVPVGLVRLHDAAALGLELSAVADPAGRPDGEASPVAASDLGRAIIANYGECRADQARLSDLQDWLTAQAQVYQGRGGAAGQDRTVDLSLTKDALYH